MSPCLASPAPARPTRPLDSRVWAALNVLLVVAVLGFAGLFLGRFWFGGEPAHRVLFFVRAVDLGTGLSPLTPLFFMCAAFAAWAYFQMRRARLAERFAVPTPFPEPDPASDEEKRIFGRIRELDRALNDEIRCVGFWSSHWRAVLAVAAGLALLGVGVWRQSLPTVEGKLWDGLFAAGFWLVFALTATTLLHLLYLWSRMKRLLAGIALTPVMRAFGRLPAKAAEVFGKYLYTQRPHPAHLQLPAHQLRLLTEAAESAPQKPAALAGLPQATATVERELRECASESPEHPTEQAEAELRAAVNEAASCCLRALAPRWKSLPVDEAFGGEALGDKEKPAGEAAEAEPAWVRHAESLVATQVVIYLSQFFMQLRNLVWAVMACSSLLLLAATSYPFHPERLLLLGLLGLTGAGVAAVLYIFIDMNRDEVVSRISRTTPGRLSLDSGFLGSFFTYILPTLGILAAQLSGTFRWALEPILRVVK